MARTLQSLGRRYVRYVNDTYHRGGTLWEGRYKASLVDDAHYLMQCHRYIELNPLRAAMVADPRDYRWSSHRGLACGDSDPLLTPHPDYLDLSPDPATRQQAYRTLVMDAVDPAEVAIIRHHLQRQHAYGSNRFREAIAAQLGRSVGPQQIGRPKQKESENQISTTRLNSLRLS